MRVRPADPHACRARQVAQADSSVREGPVGEASGAWFAVEPFKVGGERTPELRAEARARDGFSSDIDNHGYHV
jgi:hypothetical protein